MTGTVHMLCGFIGAGKTTFARQLERQVNGFRLSLDYPMVALFGTNPPQDSFVDYRNRIEGINLAYARRLLEIGVDVIFDYGFWGRAYRDKLRVFAADCGAPLKMHYIQTPDNIMRSRATARQPDQDNETLLIEPATWDKLRQYFEPPQEDEEFSLIDGISRT